MAASHHVDELLQFLVTSGQKGWIKPNTAAGLKGACERVLATLDPEEKIDVAKIDVDAALQRFANKNTSVSPQSLRVYGSRIRSAVKYFTEAKANPTGWKPPTGRSARASSNAKTPDGKTTTRRPKGASTEHVAEHRAVAGSSSREPPAVLDGGLSYPFPLRADVTITISNIPRDLRPTEVDRIAQFLKALALGDQ